MLKNVVVAAALLAAIPLCHADWQKYDVDGNGVTHYFDPSRVKRSGNILSVWEQTDDPRTGSQTTVRLEIDCKNDTGTIGYMHMAMQGKSAGREIPPEHRPVNPIVPGSLFDYFYQRYCRK